MAPKKSPKLKKVAQNADVIPKHSNDDSYADVADTNNLSRSAANITKATGGSLQGSVKSVDLEYELFYFARLNW